VLKRDKVIFLHIPKTGGSTIRQLIGRQYPTNQTITLNRGNWRTNAATIAERLADIPDPLLVMGHFRFGIHAYLPAPDSWTYVTVIRHPIRRVISQYANVTNRTAPNERQLKLREMDIVTFAGRLGHGERMTRWLAGLGMTDDPLKTTKDPKPLPADALERAKQNLRTRFACVGLLEEFPATALMMKEVFGWKSASYTVQNISRSSGGRTSVPPDIYAQLEKACAPDLALYQFAQTLFEAQKQAYGPTLERDIADLQRENQWQTRIGQVKRLLTKRGLQKALKRIRRG
jgi:hypothetical protein